MALLLILLAISLLVWVGHPVGTNAPTEWLDIATGTLALVTTILAFATIVTAKEAARTAAIAEQDLNQSKRLVEVTRRQSELSEQALSDSRRPVIIPCVDRKLIDPEHVSFVHDGQRSKEVQDFPFILCFADENSEWVVLKVRNVGGGPAIVEKGPYGVSLEQEGFGVYRGELTSRVIAPGDEVPVTFHMPKMTESPRFWVSITYCDLSYERRYRGRIVFDQKRPHPLLVDATIEDLNVATTESGVV